MPRMSEGQLLFRLSHSRVQSYFRCAKQYWFRYLSGLARPPEPQVAPLVVGKGVHRAMNALCETGRPEDGLAELEIYLRMPIHECAGPGTEWHGLAFALFEAGCAAHASIGSLARWSEQETWVPSRRRGLSVSARFDRADRFADGQWQVIDWKTGRWDLDEAVDWQLDIAHLALRTARRLPAAAMVDAVAWNLRSGERRVRRLGRADAAATMDRLAATAARIQQTAVFEAMPGPACTICEWRPQCPDAAAAAAAAEEW